MRYISRIFITKIALLGFSSAIYAQNFPLPDGLYASSEHFCAAPAKEIGEFASQIGGLAKVVENGSVFDGALVRSSGQLSEEIEISCKTLQINQIQNGFQVVRQCQDEGEVSTVSENYGWVGQTGFATDEGRFKLCAANGKFATSISDAVRILSATAIGISGSVNSATNNVVPAIQSPGATPSIPNLLTVAEITDLQWSLKSLSYYNGLLDGIISPETRKAHKAYQELNEPNNPSLDRAAIRRLGERQRATNISENFLGLSSTITAAQQALNLLGFQGFVDGALNQATRNSIIRFQQQYGLPTTATLDAFTYDRLTKAAQLWLDVNVSRNGKNIHPHASNAVAFLHEGLRPLQPVGNSSIYATGQNQALPARQRSSSASNDIPISSVETKSHQTESRITVTDQSQAIIRNETSISEELPAELRFQIARPAIQRPQHFRLQGCNEFVGITTSNHLSQKGLDVIPTHVLHDVCLNEQMTQVRHFDTVPLERNIGSSGSHLWRFRLPGGIRTNNFHVNINTPTEWDPKAPLPTTGLMRIGAAVTKQTGSSFLPQSPLGEDPGGYNFGGFIIRKSEIKTSLDDGTYHLSGNIGPIVSTNISVTVGLSGVSMNIEGEIFVKDGKATIQIFDQKKQYQSKVFGNINFNKSSENLVLASQRNWRVEGYKPETYTFMQAEIRHMITLSDGKNLGVKGIGNLNFVQTNGNNITVPAVLTLAAISKKTRQIDDAVLENADAGNFPFPQALKIPVKANLYRPRYDRLQLCSGDRGVGVLRENLQGDPDGSGFYTLVDVCINESAKSFEYVDRLNNMERTFGLDDENRFTLSKPYVRGTTGLKWGSVNVCKLGCNQLYIPPFVGRFTLSQFDASVSNPHVAYLKKLKTRSSQSHNVDGFVRGDFQPDIKNLDGVYVVSASAFGFRGGGFSFEGTMTVSNGIGRLKNYDPKLIDRGLVDFTFNFKNYEGNNLEGYSAHTTPDAKPRHYRGSVQHMIALHNKNSIGIVGIGNADFVKADGTSKQEIIKLIMSAVKLQ